MVRLSQKCRCGEPHLKQLDYLISTLAPTASSASLIFSASSLATPSFTGQGAPSANSLASLRPRPRRPLSSLTTFSLPAPAEVRTTSNSVFSAPPASPPPAGPAATATAAAAGSIPCSSLRIVAHSFTSLIVRFTNVSASSFNSAILKNFK